MTRIAVVAIGVYLLWFFLAAVLFPPRSIESLVRTLSLLVAIAGVLLGLLPLLVEKGASARRIEEALVVTLGSLLASVSTIIIGENMEAATAPSPLDFKMSALFGVSIVVFGLMTVKYAQAILEITPTAVTKDRLPRFTGKSGQPGKSDFQS